MAELGKTISIFLGCCIYLWIWAWSIEHSKDCNGNAVWEVLVARAFIGFHMGALVVWFIWSWRN